MSAARLPSLPKTLAGACLLALAGCATQVAPPDLQASLQPRDASWAQRGPDAPRLSTDAVPASWWALFNDALLPQLQDQALSGNLDVQAALLRIEESQARLGMTEATGQPRLSLDAGYARSSISADSPLAKLHVPTTPYDQWQWGGQASWEIDLWGHHAQQTAAARAQLEATQWAASAVRVTLGAEVARNYLMLRGVQAQQALVAEHRLIATELLRLTDSRERNGMATRFDAAAARAELATVAARAIQLGQQADGLRNTLALLLGEAPHQLDDRLRTASAFPPAPATLPVGVPSDLARHRPDILQAEALLRAATADKGAAQADFYPRVRLNAGLSIAATHTSDLSNWDMSQFSVGPVVHLPIFDGGLLRRTLALTDARQRSAAIAWRQTVLKAWHEVSSALDACASERARQARQAEAVDHSRVALDSARNAWRAGGADFTTVLVAQRSLLNAESALADTTTASGLAVVSLYRALGGGAPAPAPAAPPGPTFGPRLAVGMAGILLAAMVAGLNARVPALALPDTRGALGLGQDEASWLGTAYTAGELAVMPFATWFAVTFSLRRFHSWMLVSTLLLAALLPFVHELAWLLPLRALHGVVSGAMIPMLMMAALRFLPTPVRLHGLALYALTATFAPNVALWIATQWLDRLLDWRWAYWHLIPLGLLALALVQWGIPKMPQALPRLQQANWPGMVLGMPGLALLAGGLDQGQRLDWLQSPFIVAALCGGGLLTSLFLLSEWFHPGPFIKLQLLGRRNLGLGFAVFFLLLVSMSSGVALPSLDLTVQQGFRVAQLVPLGLVVGLPQLVLGPLVALLLYQRWVDARHLFALGLALIALACWVGARVDVDWMAPQFLTAQILQAIGQPLAVVSLLFLSTSVVQPMEGPYVSGIVNTLRASGTLVGGAFVSHQMSERSSFHADALMGELGRGIGQGLDTSIVTNLGTRLAQHASVLAVADVYLMLGLLALLLIPLVLMLQHIPAPMTARPTSP